MRAGWRAGARPTVRCEWGCAEVKLSLICVGALGMYVTRSLYGDRMSQGAHFQRIA